MLATEHNAYYMRLHLQLVPQITPLFQFPKAMPQKKRVNNPPTKSMWIYKAADMSRAKELLPLLSLTNTTDDVDIAWWKWVNEFVTIMEECIPKKLVPTQSETPWIKRERLETTLLDEKDSSNAPNHKAFYRDINP